jgi:glutamate/tyrosine decarboxylase-like PLP-dependent enzyme
MKRPPADELAVASLDPSDWQGFRRLCHTMVDRALDTMMAKRSQPVWQPVPAAIKQQIAEPLPRDEQGAEKACEDFTRLIEPYATGNTHPRFFGWVHGAGTPIGALAEFLAAAMNANVGGRDHGAVYVERQVIEWCRQIFGFPTDTSGVLVSGTSMATLIGLTVARNSKAGHDVRVEGLGGAGGLLVAYASSEVHGAVPKVLEILGLGRNSLRLIPVDADYRMKMAALREAVERDRRAGLTPFCVIGTAGTVNSGATDPLAEMADFCAAENLWFHVDGAFGAFAILAEPAAADLAGMERADSLAFDFHKWLHVPYDAGCVLIRQGALHQQAFAGRPAYLAPVEHGLAAGAPWFCDYGPELSRGFRALKVWFTIKSHGVRRLGRQIARNCALARSLAEQVKAQPAFQLLAPVPLNIVCLRYVGALRQPAVIDAVNKAIVADLQESGVAAPSTTRIGGALAIRVCICNHRTREADIAMFLQTALARGRAQEALIGGEAVS